MFLRAITLIAALGIIYVTSEPIRVYRREQDYDKILACLQGGYKMIQSKLEAKGGVALTDADKIENTCDFIAKMKGCLLGAAQNAPVPRIIYFSIAYVWQHLIMAHKSGMCRDVSEGELAAVADKAVKLGIIPMPPLKNIANDPYKPCVGKIMRDCFIEQETSFEGQPDHLNPSLHYTECYQEKAADPSYNCAGSPMMKHFLQHGEATRAEWKAIKQ